MENQKRMSWNLKGRKAVAVLDPSTRHCITRSHIMISSHKSLLATLEALITVKYVGGLSGPLKRPEPFICLITRLLQITPEPSIVLAMLHQDVHKYLRVAALFVIRLIGNTAMVREALRVGWDDYRKIRLYGSSEDLAGPLDVSESVDKKKKEEEEEEAMAKRPSFGIMCVDEITDRLFYFGEDNTNTNMVNSSSWLGIRFSPLLL